MKNYYKLLLLLLSAMLMVSCGTKKQAVSTTTTSDASEATALSLKQIVEAVNANRQDETFATAKMKIGISSSDKSLSIGGTLRMKRNDVIQLSLVTFGIIEVARIEMTPDYFMGIDKMGKQYVKAAWGDVSFFKSAGIDFYTLQALFWLAVLSFSVNIASGLIRQTTISPHVEGVSPYLDWRYMDFSSLGKKYFPTHHLLNISSSKPITATITLSNLENDSGWETRTQTPGRSYTEITVEKLLSRIMSLTK